MSMRDSERDFNKRNRIPKQKRMLYFAYGSCMNLEDFHRTVPGAEAVGTAVLKNYRLAFTMYSHTRRGGVADIVPSKGSQVEGVLYELTPVEFEWLDSREGAPVFYRRKRVRVERQDGSVVWATTYEVTRKSVDEWQPSREYALIIWEGARVLSLAYRKMLKENLLKVRKVRS
jgi:cation transport regulator ChaC